jgi:hypothetical protein
MTRQEQPVAFSLQDAPESPPWRPGRSTRRKVASGSAFEQCKTPLRSTTTQFKDVPSSDVAQNAQLGFRNAPHTPRQCFLPESRPVRRLVGITDGPGYPLDSGAPNL